MQPLPRKVKGHREADLTLIDVISLKDASCVYRGTLQVDPEPLRVAAKNSTHPGNVEIGILRLIGCHPNVVHLLEATMEGDETYILLELCEGSLDLLPALEGGVFKNFAKDFVKVVSYLHNNLQLAHGCLSLEHLLLNKDSRLKVCSFSRAKPCQNVNLLKGDLYFMGISIYLAPMNDRDVNFRPTIAQENPSYLVSTLSSNRTTLTLSDSILLASLVYPLFTGLTLAEGLKNHIFLQSPEDMLRFIDGCKDFLMSRRNIWADRRLEQAANSVVGTNWVSRGHLDAMREGRRYNNSITDLLRLIRNKGEHYSSLPGYIKQCLGHPLVDPGSFLQYFTGLFPGLIAWTWHCMYEFKEEANLQAFYPENSQFLTRVPIEELIRSRA